MRHAGTTDVDVQVDLEIAAGAVNTVRLERALVNAEFKADPSRVWRWETEADGHNVVAKFELLADLDGEPAGAVVHFDECDVLGAVNVRGTGFAARDYSSLTLQSRIGGVDYEVGVNITGIAGFPIAKAAAARSRRAEKDWYEIAFVLLHNYFGGPEYAARVTSEHFRHDLVGSVRTALDDLLANFDSPDGHGPRAYASQVLVDHPGADDAQLRADAVLKDPRRSDHSRRQGVTPVTFCFRSCAEPTAHAVSELTHSLCGGVLIAHRHTFTAVPEPLHNLSKCGTLFRELGGTSVSQHVKGDVVESGYLFCLVEEKSKLGSGQ